MSIIFGIVQKADNDREDLFKQLAVYGKRKNIRFIFGYSDPFHPVQILWGWLTDKVWFDKTHINNWSTNQFQKIVSKNFKVIEMQRTSPFAKFIAIGKYFKGDIIIYAKAKSHS